MNGTAAPLLPGRPPFFMPISAKFHRSLRTGASAGRILLRDSGRFGLCASREVTMFTVPRESSWSLIGTLEGLFRSHPAAVMGGLPTRSAQRRADEALAQMPPHLRDDLGLPPVQAARPEHPALTWARNRASRWGS